MRLLEARPSDAGIELDIAAQVEAFRHVPRVGQELRLGRVALAPVPFLLRRWVELIGVLHALHVAARAGIAVPVPGAPDIATRLEDAHVKAQAAQTVQHVETGKARPDDDDIEGSGGPGTLGPGTLVPGTLGPGTLGPGTLGRVLLWHGLAQLPAILDSLDSLDSWATFLDRLRGPAGAKP